MRDLSFRGPPQLAVAENATTPTGVLGAVIWSTTAGKKLEWDGSKWAGPGSGTPGSGDVVGPATSVAGAIPVFDDTTGKLLAVSPLRMNEAGALDLSGIGVGYGLPGQSLRSNGPTYGPYWNFDGYPDMDCDEGVAFSSNVMVTSTGRLATLKSNWFPGKLTGELAMPAGFWVSVSIPSDPGDKIFFFSYDDDALRIAVFSMADFTATPTILPVPTGLPAITGTNYVGTVSDDGMHFYVGINGALYHITADSPGVLSTGSTVEGTTITEPGSGSMEQVLISEDGTGLLILDGTSTVHRYTLGTPFSLASAGAPVAVPLDTAYTYYGMSYHENDAVLLFHHDGLGSADVVQSDVSLAFDATAYAQRTFLHSLTQPAPAVVVSRTPPANPSENQLWLDIS